MEVYELLLGMHSQLSQVCNNFCHRSPEQFEQLRTGYNFLSCIFFNQINIVIADLFIWS